jgi:hypothetical protein
MVLDAKDLLPMAMERASQLNTLWNLFIVVATAILGIMATGKSFTNSWAIKMLISLVFFCFAACNLDGIYSLTVQRENLDLLLQDPHNSQYLTNVIEALKPFPWYGYLAFHLFLDAVVLVAIWRVRWGDAEKNQGGFGG